MRHRRVVIATARDAWFFDLSRPVFTEDRRFALVAIDPLYDGLGPRNTFLLVFAREEGDFVLASVLRGGGIGLDRDPGRGLPGSIPHKP